MTPRKVNVLVYAGAGSTEGSVRHALFTLRRLLSPNYAVISVSEKVIVNEPWTSSCALLVFPGGADLGYCRQLNGKGNDRISQYVRRGGAYLGLCAGAYYGSQKCEFEVGDPNMEVVGRRELAFFPGTSRGLAFKGFVYGSEAGARAVELLVQMDELSSSAVANFRSYYNGGGVFVDAEKYESHGVEVLARYGEALDVDSGKAGTRAAVVYCKVGDGCAILSGAHPEFAAVNLDKRNGGPHYAKVVEAVDKDEQQRTAFMRACLSKMGLIVTEEVPVIPTLSALHVTSMYRDGATTLLHDLKKDGIRGEGGQNLLKGENDTFLLVKQDSLSLDSLSASLPSSDVHVEDVMKADQLASDASDYSKVIKNVIFHEDCPSTSVTPHFDHNLFYESLLEYQHEAGSRATEFGNTLMYGETVTSTNTILETNQRLLNHLPNGFTATATVQVAGRGRGSNVWVSPIGVLMFSTCMRHSLELSQKAPVVFVQYLMAIAIAEGIRSYGRGYEEMPVKLKWPNDIYALDPTKPGRNEYVKIGGILINSSYSNESYNLVCGAGINCNNSAPTTSLNALHPEKLAPYSIEKLLARILTSFEGIYKRFCNTGFDAQFEKQYYELWLHTDQIVTLEAEGGVRARILGITRDWGLLRVEELGWEDRPTGNVLELQTDSNSFDFFRGLVKAKT